MADAGNLTTWTDVANNFVKIGGGSVAGGIVTFCTLWWQHKKEVSKENLENRTKLIQQALDLFSEVDACFGFVFGQCIYMQEASNRTEGDFAQLGKRLVAYTNASQNIAKIRAYLLVVDEKIAHAAAEEFIEMSNDATESMGTKGRPLHSDEIRHIEGLLESTRRKFYRAIGDALTK